MKNDKRGLSDHPIIILLGLVSGLLTIFIFIFGIENIKQAINIFREPTRQAKNQIDCSLTTEIGPWLNSNEIVLNQNRDGWIQADFWLPNNQLVQGYDEVSVIFDPSLRITVSGAAGIAWRYDRSWKEEDVIWCTNKHIEDSWNIRHKKLILISSKELCEILSCQ